MKERAVAMFLAFLLLCLLAGCGSSGIEKTEKVRKIAPNETTPVTKKVTLAPAARKKPIAVSPPTVYWSSQTIELPADNKWHGYPISQGKQYRYQISGEVSVQDGFGAVRKFHADDTLIFLGSQSEIDEMARQHPGGDCLGVDDNRIHGHYANSSGSGKASKSGYIWFLLYTTVPLNGGMTVILETKN